MLDLGAFIDRIDSIPLCTSTFVDFLPLVRNCTICGISYATQPKTKTKKKCFNDKRKKSRESNIDFGMEKTRL